MTPFCSSDGTRLRPPDAHGEGGGVWACCQQHGRRRPGQAAVAQEPQLWGVCVRLCVCVFVCVTHLNSLLLLLLQVWFDRRTNYTRSLAVMSMVGYILGLGDRSVSQSLGPGEHLVSHTITRTSAKRFSLSNSSGIRPTWCWIDWAAKSCTSTSETVLRFETFVSGIAVYLAQESQRCWRSEQLPTW